MQERYFVYDLELCLSILFATWLDISSETLRHDLPSIAYTEDRHSHIEDISLDIRSAFIIY